jgi:hypothetical protein
MIMVSLCIVEWARSDWIKLCRAVLFCSVYIQDQLIALQALIQGREIDAIWGRSHGRKAQQAMRKSLWNAIMGNRRGSANVLSAQMAEEVGPAI